VRRYLSSEGFEILVGKTGKENDRLTFQMAGPEDFWLHAVGAAGAHVVVRNTGRLANLPQQTLIEAARIAAYFSRAGRSGKAEVHVTRRKYVRRARGAPRGTVILKRFRSVSVEPREPRDEKAAP
jgi:predicted ribosome quality control (RQC) complex YloA/Tae2 family protein